MTGALEINVSLSPAYSFHSVRTAAELSLPCLPAIGREA